MFKLIVKTYPILGREEPTDFDPINIEIIQVDTDCLIDAIKMEYKGVDTDQLVIGADGLLYGYVDSGLTSFEIETI